MKGTLLKNLVAAGFGATLALGAALPAAGQDGAAAQREDRPRAASLAQNAVAPGTRFLVRTEEELTTRNHEENKKFKVITLEPLEAGNGLVVPPGAEIRGHVSRVEAASLTGRARLWLTFDEISTKYGKLPIVANVVSVPGEHSVKSGPSKEGEIEARRSRGKEDVEAAAAGAAIGAVAGGKATHSGKGAGIGAAVGAAAGFLASSGLGRELDLLKGTKLELELERPLYLPNK